jgi:hypothetical protein
MYSAKGTLISGFDYFKSGTISTQPKHFRIASKDYIVFAADNKMKVLSRRGKERVNVRESIDFSGNPIFQYKDQFITSDTSGNIIKVDTRGNVSKESATLQPSHMIDATSKTLVSFSENRLNIRSRFVDMDYGNYSEPKIYYLNDKIYITITDKQTKQVYLFDSQGKSIPNFPIFGTEKAVLEKLDRESGLELITQADDDTIIVYKLN